MAAPLPLALFGITGRMGQSLVVALRADPGWRIAAAMASKASHHLGLDAALEGPATGVAVTADDGAEFGGAVVAVDFSRAEAVAGHAARCAAAGIPLLVGATGLDAATHSALERAAERIAVLIAPNTSVGVSVLAGLAAEAARRLGAGFDIEILEAHHRGKRDAPSGTALALGEAVAAARGQTLEQVAVYDRHGVDAVREPGSIGFAVMRCGDVIGEHTVVFAGTGERLALSHVATDRLTFARGALRGAAWLVGRSAGLYRMQDVLTRP